MIDMSIKEELSLEEKLMLYALRDREIDIVSIVNAITGTPRMTDDQHIIEMQRNLLHLFFELQNNVADAGTIDAERWHVILDLWLELQIGLLRLLRAVR